MHYDLLHQTFAIITMAQVIVNDLILT